MQFGVCGGPGIAAAAAAAGMAYVEGSVQALLVPRAPRLAFLEAWSAYRASGLPCPVCNCFLPGDLKIVGPSVDAAAIEQYVRVACERAQEAGVDTIVFGSGGARQIPEGFSREQAMVQLAEFLRHTAVHASRHDVTIVIEPLRRAECNVLNTVDECAALVTEVASPAIRLLVDGYHWAHNGESPASIVRHAALFAHMHVATRPNRRPPDTELCADLGTFLTAVRETGYQGRMSVEGRIDQPETELPLAVARLREALAG